MDEKKHDKDFDKLAMIENWCYKVKFLFNIRHKEDEKVVKIDDITDTKCFADHYKSVKEIEEVAKKFKIKIGDDKHITTLHDALVNEEVMSMLSVKDIYEAVNKLKIPKNTDFQNILSDYLFNKDIGNIRGDEAELNLFEELKNKLKSKCDECKLNSDFTILHSCKLPEIKESKDSYSSIEDLLKNIKQTEKDFIIFSASRKKIISIEVKYRYQKKAYKQLLDAKKILENHFDLEGWQIIPVIFIYMTDSKPDKMKINVFTKDNVAGLLEVIIGSSNDQADKNSAAGHSNDEKASDQSEASLPDSAPNNVPNKTKTKVFTKDNVDGLWKFIIGSPNDQAAANAKNANNQLKSFLQVILLVKYNNIKPTSDIKKFNELSKPSNIIFYTKGQHLLLTSDKYKKVMITGPYGTGKSIVLQEKAKMLAEKGERVLLLFGCAKNSLLQKQLELDWSVYKNVVLDNLMDFVSKILFLEFTFPQERRRITFPLCEYKCNKIVVSIQRAKYILNNFDSSSMKTLGLEDSEIVEGLQKPPTFDDLEIWYIYTFV